MDGTVDPHHAESARARASGDPREIKELYASYGQQLVADFGDRPDEVVQHGSRLVADWQARELVGLRRRGTVVDIGCGPRPEISMRLAAPEHHVVSVDLSPGLLTLAREVARGGPTAAWMSFVVGDAEALPFRDRSVAVVVADDVLEHVPAPRRMAAECARVVRLDGLVSISTPNRRALSVLVDRTRDLLRLRIRPREAYYLVPSHLVEFTRPELRRLFAPFYRSQRYHVVGWDDIDSLVKRVANRVTAWRLLHQFSRTWIVVLAEPLP